MLQEHLARYKDIYQYVYSHVFPEVYASSEKRDFDLKNNFHIMFKAYRDKTAMKQQQLTKQPTNYLIQNHEKFEFEQKPIRNFDEFSDTEEKELKNNAQNQTDLKLADDKVKEGEMWNRLNKLNGEFKKIKQANKDKTKISSTILSNFHFFSIFNCKTS